MLMEGGGVLLSTLRSRWFLECLIDAFGGLDENQRTLGEWLLKAVWRVNLSGLKKYFCEALIDWMRYDS